MTATSMSAHQRPRFNRDYEFYLEGLDAGEVRAQRCTECLTLRHPPAPMCSLCNSLCWDIVPLKGMGTVYSYIIHYHPPIPPFPTPHPVVLVDMDEGVRVLAALHDCPLEDISIGMRVTMDFIDLASDFRIQRFRPDS